MIDTVSLAYLSARACAHSYNTAGIDENTTDASDEKLRRGHTILVIRRLTGLDNYFK